MSSEPEILASFDNTSEQWISPIGPEILELSISKEISTIHCRVPPSLLYLSGHFSDFPVVPGFVQLNWVLGMASQYCNIPSHVSTYEAIKFKALLQPDDYFTIALKYNEKGKVLSFSLSDEEQEFSSGRFKLA